MEARKNRRLIAGVLAFQGNFAEHIALLEKMKVDGREVRTVADLHGITHLIIPGGESTVMAKFLARSGLDKEIVRCVKNGTLAVFGTCAGAILLSTLGLLDMRIERNAYGTQAQSFQEAITVRGIPGKITAPFIRAPRIVHVGRGVAILAWSGRDPILLQYGRILASTFHPELRGEEEIHRLFLSM